jgi:hypothetical protein
MVIGLEQECSIDSDDVIEIGLEHRRKPEVVHRYSKKEHIGTQQLIDQEIADLQGFTHRRSALIGLAERGCDPGFRYVRRREYTQIAGHDFCIGKSPNPEINEQTCQAARM